MNTQMPIVIGLLLVFLIPGLSTANEGEEIAQETWEAVIERFVDSDEVDILGEGCCDPRTFSPRNVGNYRSLTCVSITCSKIDSSCPEGVAVESKEIPIKFCPDVYEKYRRLRDMV